MKDEQLERLVKAENALRTAIEAIELVPPLLEASERARLRRNLQTIEAERLRQHPPRRPNTATRKLQRRACAYSNGNMDPTTVLATR